MSGDRGSVALRLMNPVVAEVCQSAFRRYHDDLDGMRTFLDRAGAASGLLARRAPGCRILDGELGGLPTREFHPARLKARAHRVVPARRWVPDVRAQGLHRIPLADGE